ncbi:uncharacterized protein LACBIDRAFT_303795 [Laccaria bicolor S238N-H82]|uniref:Predicted protein n=1 Tax=Laccaria bicolor (strain S238N-H82 / ATCC MYA-4686) TaxID=486041 RepID=B0DKC1_LACBS|nr:uncharacterized protein LACBIDRAFT_303795 [Laccaria bicolor S238N-H82]EDR05043.1 predicted protein [Laccaria bicolor S238N-H82]|eukprot:XP_001884433.1 predicted protein [Laccaria bicolor S238N-H82]
MFFKFALIVTESACALAAVATPTSGDGGLTPCLVGNLVCCRFTFRIGVEGSSTAFPLLMNFLALNMSFAATVTSSMALLILIATPWFKLIICPSVS